MTTVNVNEKTLIECRIIQHAGEQKVFLKCDWIEPIFAAETDQYTERSETHSTEYYRMTPRAIKDTAASYGVQVDSYGYNLLREGVENYSLLRTKGIGQGITVNLKSAQSIAALRSWASGLAKFAERLYVDVYSPISIDFKVSMTTAEAMPCQTK